MMTTYFDRFFEEKDLPYQVWDIEVGDTVHIIDSEAVIEAIKGTPANERRTIRNMLTRIDFVNGDVMDYLKHLATCMAQVHEAEQVKA